LSDWFWIFFAAGRSEFSLIVWSVTGISGKKLESWLDEQDEDLIEHREELKKHRKQQENTLRVTPQLTSKFFLITKL